MADNCYLQSEAPSCLVANHATTLLYRRWLSYWVVVCKPADCKHYTIFLHFARRCIKIIINPSSVNLFVKRLLTFRKSSYLIKSVKVQLLKLNYYRGYSHELPPLNKHVSACTGVLLPWTDHVIRTFKVYEAILSLPQLKRTVFRKKLNAGRSRGRVLQVINLI